MKTLSFHRTTEDKNRELWKATSEISLDSNIKSYEPNPTFQLHMIQKKEPKSERPPIKSTKCQRLSFYRAYTAPANKTEIICRQHHQFNRFIWLYAMNLIFKSLPHTFVHIFLALYAPEHHIFLTKMVPFCIGYKFLLIAASFFEIATYMNTLLLMFHYFMHGILFKNPWNRCKNETYFDKELNKTIHCYELEEFSKQIVNMSYHFSGHTYNNLNNETFQMAQVEYFRLNIGPTVFIRDMVYFAILWSMAAYLTYYVSRKSFWKVLHYVHWAIISIDFLAFLYLISTQSKVNNEDTIHSKRTFGTHKYWLADIDMLVESTTAPPVAHILTSRSTQPVTSTVFVCTIVINPSRDSTAIVVSNAVLYMFRVLLTAKITTHCENIVGAPIYYLEADDHNFFFIWPIFFSSFYLGDLYNLAFLGFNFVTEILTVTVVFRCLIEMVIYEWTKKIKIQPWMVIIGMFVGTIMMYSFIGYESQEVLYIYSKGFATLSEVVILYIFYPVGRLVDDYTFHFGIPPTKLRKLSIQLVPFYYLIKFVIMMDALFDIFGNSNFGRNVPHYKWSWYLMLLPLILGMMYTVFTQVLMCKGSWTQIFSPDPDWGPNDFSVRQLRKQYDSRVYIKSDVPRQLSRYLMSKAESKVYKINVRYDFYKRNYGTSMEVRFRNEDDEEKNTKTD